MRWAQALAMTLFLRTTAGFLAAAKRPLPFASTSMRATIRPTPFHLRLMMISTEVKGGVDTEEFRLFFKASSYVCWALLCSAVS